VFLYLAPFQYFFGIALG